MSAGRIAGKRAVPKKKTGIGLDCALAVVVSAPRINVFNVSIAPLLDDVGGTS